MSQQDNKIILIDPNKKPNFKITITSILVILTILFLSTIIYLQTIYKKISEEKSKETSTIFYNCVKEITLNINGYNNQKIVLQHPCSISIIKINSSTTSSINESSLLIECVNGCPP